CAPSSLLRARQLLRHGASFGLLATNTIAQGDTREVGLDQIVGNGCEIYRAVPSRKWPGEASLEVAHVWVRRGDWQGGYVLDDWPLDRTTAPPGYSGPVAADYPDCLAIIERDVRPERQRRHPDGSYVLRRPLPERFWHYADKRPALYATIAGMERVLVRTQVSN